MKIKNFKLFESSSINNIEVENLIEDILINLKDLDNEFSWKVIFPKRLSYAMSEHFHTCELHIICEDAYKSSKIDSNWISVMSQLISVLNSEDIRVYEAERSISEVKPNSIDKSWTPIWCNIRVTSVFRKIFSIEHIDARNI
jgi:hypothetical protein